MVYAEIPNKRWVDVRNFAYRCVCKFTNNIDLAEDITQEVMLSLLDSVHYINSEYWKGVVYRIAYRRWIDYLRKSYRLPLLTNVDETMQSQHWYWPIRNDGYGDSVQSALDKLSPKILECVISVCVDGYTHQETADRFDIPLGTVLSRVFRGKANLKLALEKTYNN